MRQLIRTTITVVILSAIVLMIYWRMWQDQQQKAIAELQAMNEALQHNLAVHQAMVDRLGRTRRLAHVRILEQGRRSPDAESGPSLVAVGDLASGPALADIQTKVLFIELDDEGMELARQTFTVPGDVLFLDAWTVKFDHERVAEGHPLMGRTLVLLRRIYSDQMPPREGFLIDTPGAVPPAYAVSDAGRFQKMIWETFWSIATDAKLARQMGVRVAQGEAVYKPVRTGQVFELLVDAAGGMSMRPLDDDENAAITQAGMGGEG